MSRKDYVVIAAGFKSLVEASGSHPLANSPQPNLYLTGVVAAIEKFADVASDENPRFDRARFIGACGLSVLPTIKS